MAGSTKFKIIASIIVLALLAGAAFVLSQQTCEPAIGAGAMGARPQSQEEAGLKGLKIQ